jgi:glutaconyl-CoA/methylmalonyl-CoA decarboxylase subunit gamma
MERYTVTVGSRTFVIDVSEVAHDEFLVQVEGHEFNVHLAGGDDAVHAATPHEGAPHDTAAPHAAPARQAAPAAPSASLVMTTPMPGTVASVLVHPGDAVARGDVLLQLEAMKMTNAVRAPHDAVVAEVLVVEGQQVAYGAPLLRLTER